MIDFPVLPSLPGTAPDGAWRMGTADRDEADGRLATFAIVTRRTPTSLKLLGTGFYLVPNGGFATAAHVALEAQTLMSQGPERVGIIHVLATGRPVFRPVAKFFLHPTADIAFGIPYEIVDQQYRAKVLSLEIGDPPEIGAPISTWAYPLHRVLGDEETGSLLQLQPDFYDGVLQEFFAERGPSVKLRPPYYRTSIHLYGGSSGGPVFNADGYVFGIASSSYDGNEDIAFVTPIGVILEIELHVNLGDGRGSRTVAVQEITDLGRISVRREC
jgi:hypothetical protein